MHNRKRLHSLVLVSLLALPILAACGKDEGPTETLNAAVQHLADGDWAALSALTTNPASLDNSEMVGEVADLLQAVTHHLEVEVLEQEIKGDRATLQARVKNVSVPGVMTEFLTFGNALMYGLMGEEGEAMMIAAMIEKVREDGAPTRTEVVPVEFRKVQGKWRFHLDDDLDEVAPPFWNAFLGYMADI